MPGVRSRHLGGAIAAVGLAAALTLGCAAPSGIEEQAAPVFPVRVGLDRVAAGEVGGLRGKRLGLLAHGASVTLDGKHAVQVFREQGLDLVRLFGPEHGLRGLAAAGEKVEDGVDAATGLPVVSLYGARSKPAPEDLAGLDALVVDLQDAGVRFYTYSSTMLLCLEAAAETGIELVVLDRPNPLGGERVAGPERGPARPEPPSLVDMAPGPLIHGLTMGEIARYANARRDRPARLRVIAMRGWRRAMIWHGTGRSWVPPSPNLRSADAAIAYPGVALLEATNVSEGRGTATPFLVFGAPWLDSARLSIEVPGFRLAPIRFTPRASAAAPSPKHVDVECEGFAVAIEDPGIADPYRLGVALLLALQRQRGFEWLRGGEALDRLTGSTDLRQALRALSSLEEILATRAEAPATWREATRPLLLYR